MTLIDQLERDEGMRYWVYDDATGQKLFPLLSGGKRTVGVGRNIDDVPFSADEVRLMLANDIAARQRELAQYSWFITLDETRKASVINMSFMGVAKLLHFPTMIHCLGLKDYDGAAAAALDSDWARELHYDPANPLASRPGRVAQQLRTGEWT